MAMLAALREEAEAADASLRPTVAEERAVLEAARQHVLEHGVNAKAGGATTPPAGPKGEIQEGLAPHRFRLRVLEEAGQVLARSEVQL